MKNSFLAKNLVMIGSALVVVLLIFTLLPCTATDTATVIFNDDNNKPQTVTLAKDVAPFALSAPGITGSTYSNAVMRKTSVQPLVQLIPVNANYFGTDSSSFTGYLLIIDSSDSTNADYFFSTTFNVPGTTTLDKSFVRWSPSSTNRLRSTNPTRSTQNSLTSIQYFP